MGLAQVRRGARAASRRRSVAPADITETALTSGGPPTTDASSYTTASISPSPNKLILCAVYTTLSSGTPAVAVSGCGLTWELVISTQIITAGRTVWLFRAMGPSPTTGQLTITTGATLTNIFWDVREFGGVNQTGTNGAGAIRQSDQSRGTTSTSFSDPFPAAVAAGNVAYAAVGVSVAENPTPGTGWAARHQATQSNLVNGFLAMVAAPAVSPAAASWTSSATFSYVGVEIQAA